MIHALRIKMQIKYYHAAISDANCQVYKDRYIDTDIKERFSVYNGQKFIFWRYNLSTKIANLNFLN